MSRLYDRKIQIEVGGVVLTKGELVFDVIHTSTPEPATASVVLVNLSPGDRARVESAPRRSQIVVSAGYADPGPFIIFTGDVRRVVSRREGPDILTEIEAQAGLNVRSLERRLDKGYAKGTQFSAVVLDLVAATGADRGNIGDILSTTPFRGQLAAPLYVSGPAWDSLVSICHARGVEISTKGDRINLTERGETSSRREVARIAPGTGLIGSPSLDKAGLLQLNTQMLPGFWPGVLFSLEDEFVQGAFKATKIQHAGSYYGGEFGMRIEARRLV